jgi:hypothetical protein
MRVIRFGDLPFLVRLAVGLAFFTAWIVFEETIVDRRGLWRYMPHYRVGDPCIWDAGMALAIVVGLALASRCRLRCCAGSLTAI